MADEEKKAATQEGAPPEEDAGKKGMKPALVIPLFAVVYGLMMIAGWFVTNSVIAPKLSASLIEKEKAALLPEAQEENARQVGEIHVIEDLVVNPAESGGSRYVAASVAFEVNDPEMIPDFERHDPQIKDFLIRLLGSRTVAELADVRTREQLRQDIRSEMEKTFGEGSIKAVYFVSFVLQ